MRRVQLPALQEVRNHYEQNAVLSFGRAYAAVQVHPMCGLSTARGQVIYSLVAGENQCSIRSQIVMKSIAAMNSHAAIKSGSSATKNGNK